MTPDSDRWNPGNFVQPRIQILWAIITKPIVISDLEQFPGVAEFIFFILKTIFACGLKNPV